MKVFLGTVLLGLSGAFGWAIYAALACWLRPSERARDWWGADDSMYLRICIVGFVLSVVALIVLWVPPP